MLKNRIGFFVLLFLTGAAAYLINNRLGYTPLLFLLFLAVMDAVFAAAARLCVTASQKGDIRVVTRGEPIKATFTLNNISPFFIIRARAKLQFEGNGMEKPFSGSTSFLIAPRDSVMTWLTIAPRHVGVYQVRITKMRIFGPLGLFAFSYRPKFQQFVYSIPKIIDGSLAGASEISDEEIAGARGSLEQNQENYNGVREYAPGDPMHSIHWKLTAHSAKYMTRIYEDEGTGSLCIALDLRIPRNAGDSRLYILDKLLETAVSAVHQRVLYSKRVLLVYEDDSGIQRLHADSLQDVTDISVMLVSAKTPEQFSVPLSENAVVVTANADMELAAALAEQSGTGGQPTLVYITPGAFESAESRKFFRFLAQHQVTVQKVMAE